MYITSIEEIVHEKPIYKIYVNNEYTFSVSQEDYFKYHLYEKNEITEQEIEKIKKSVNFSAAKSAALIYLSYKLRSEKEVRLKLNMNNYSQEIIERVIKELIVDGYINDDLYVRKFLYERNKLNPRSTRALRAELQKKGINKVLIEKGIEDLQLDDLVIAKELLEKKFKGLDYSEKKTRRKIYHYLQYRGFNISIIKEALKN